MRESGLVAVSDTSFFKPKCKVKKKLFCNVSKEIRGKGFCIFFFCKRLQFTLEIDIPFGIGRTIDDLPVLDAFLVFECLFKIIDHLLDTLYFDLGFGRLDFIEAM